MNTDIKLPILTRLGYGAASIADTIILDFVGAFFLFFLTNLVGINPALAGSVTLVAIIWDAITDPIVGNLADRSRAKGGRYRRFVLISILPIFICCTLMFLKVQFGTAGTFIYFMVVAMLYYTSYTVFNIPYMALGSSLTSNEMEKTKLSGTRQSFGFAGALFSGAVPAVMIDGFQEMGVRDDLSYTFTAAVLGFLAAFTIFITWLSTRGRELDFGRDRQEKEGIVRNLRDIFSCRSYVIVIASAFTFYISFTMISGSIMYVINGILGLSEGASSGIFVILAVSGIALCAVYTRAARRWDKKIIYFAATVFAALYMLYTKIAGIHSLTGFGIYIVMVNFGFSSYLMFIYNFLYDVVDIIEFRTGRRNSGAIFAYFSFIIKLGKAGAMQLVGLLLMLGNYDASLAIQGAEGKNAILNMVTVWPAVLSLISAALIWMYPVTAEKMEALHEAAQRKQKGEPYDVEKFEKLL